jgi:hypothetical protein
VRWEKPPPKTKKQRLKEKAAAAKAATDAAAAKVAAREHWAHDALLLTSFFPAFTMGGRQPYAVFTRPNGDIVVGRCTLNQVLTHSPEPIAFQTHNP